MAGTAPGGGGGDVVHLHPVTPLSSNFVQIYSGVGSIFCDKKNRDQINLCSDEYRKLLKRAYFKIAAASSFIESY